ncbi:hypothetical protein LEN26_013756 [Aphanomyces euteiches]|nr:hypothetical protein LEN26_013756 [Aphanomyces euteiches]
MEGEQLGFLSEPKVGEEGNHQALLSAKLMNRDTIVLADTGADMSVVHLRVAEALSLPIDRGKSTRISRLGPNSIRTLGTVPVKLTIGRGIAYYLEFDVCDLGNVGFNAVLGMDFLSRACTTIDTNRREISLPDGEQVPLLHQPTRYHRGNVQYLETTKQTWIAPGESAVEPTRRALPLAQQDCERWVHRSTRWIATFVTGVDSIPVAVRITNVSAYSISLLPRTIVGAITVRGERPLDVRMARTGSNRYKVWEDEIYEGTFSPHYLRKREARLTDPPVQRPTTTESWPRVLKTRYGELPLRPDETHDDSDLKPSNFEADKNRSASQADSLPLTTDEPAEKNSQAGGPPAPQIFALQSVPDLDQSELEPEVVVREGIDMTTEEMESQLAFIPEIVPDPTPIRLEDLDYGEPDQPEEEKAKMRNVLAKYMPYFIQSGNGLPPAARGAVCDIDVGSARPIAQRARRVRPEHLKQLFELLKGLLEYGLITFSTSPWASPIVIVLKKGGRNIRLCIDYRAINDLQSLLLSPMPTLDSMLANFDAVQWFLSLDNASGFWVVRSTRRARLISAFICPLGHFEWTRMAQGLKNAPMIYQRMITNALFGFVDLPPGVADLDNDGEPRDMFMINYKYPEESMPPVANRTSFADDISDGAETWDEIVELTDRILRRLTYFNVSISASKSKFGKREIEFLGHWISRRGLSAKPKGLEKLVNLEFPDSLQGIQSFPGSLNFYSRFVENYAIKASSLYEISREDIEAGVVSDTARIAFEELKAAFANLPTLKHAAPDKEVHVLIYTTNWAISATVCQEDEGVLYPIRFCGRVLKGGECRYEGWAKEILALLRVLKTCFFEVRGWMIVVYTRYGLMRWLLKDKQAKAENLHWAAMLAPWTIKVVPVEELDGRWNLPIMLTETLHPPDESTHEKLVLYEPNRSKVGLQPRQVKMPTFTEHDEVYVATFDGAIKVKERFGSWGAVIWKLPSWELIWAGAGCCTDATVNVAEYEGAKAVLRAAIEQGIQAIHVFGDSKLVIHQALEWMQCKQEHLQLQLKSLRALEKQLSVVEYHHILRQWNGSADHLAAMSLATRKAITTLSLNDLNDVQAKNLLAELIQHQPGPEEPPDEGKSSKSIFAYSHPKPTSRVVGLNMQIRLLRVSQAQDRELKWSIIKRFLRGELGEMTPEECSSASKEAGMYEIGEGALFRLMWSQRRTNLPVSVWNLVIPTELIPVVLHHCHDSVEGGHFKFHTTYERLRKHFYWSGMYTDAKNYVAACETCASGGPPPTTQARSPGNLVPQGPLELINFDIATDLPRSFGGNTQLVVFVDNFTGYVMCKPTPDRSAHTLAKAFEETVFVRFGACKEVRHDREPSLIHE